MLKHHVNSQGFWRWWSDSLWIHMVCDPTRRGRVEASGCSRVAGEVIAIEDLPQALRTLVVLGSGCVCVRYVSLRLWIEAQNPYEFIRVLNVLLRILILYGVWTWCSGSLWFYSCFSASNSWPWCVFLTVHTCLRCPLLLIYVYRLSGKHVFLDSRPAIICYA